LSILCCLFLMTGNVCIVIKVSSSLNVIEVQRVKAPVLDGKIEDLEWMNATFLDFNFTFANGESHRANVYLGHTTLTFSSARLYLMWDKYLGRIP